MPVNMGKMETGPGWGCSDPSFRMGEPDLQTALKRLADSANVTVEDKGAYRDGTHHFEAWTEPGNRYAVVFDPGKPGGYCKHVVACLVHWLPWHRQMALGAGWALERIAELEKENKRLEKEIKKLERENRSLRG
jgi:hypothetical protein